MKKILSLLVFAYAVISCSGNDSVDVPAPVVAVPSKIIVHTGSDVATYDFSYDAKRRISRITVASDINVTLDFFYDNDDHITKIEKAGDESGTYNYLYDTGKLVEYTASEGDQDTPVTYNNIEDQYYTFAPEHIFSFYDNMDLKRGDDVALVYDNTKKGGFANVNSSYQLVGIFGPDQTNDLIYFGGKKPLDNVGPIGNPMQFDFTNVYGDGGYIQKATVDTLTIEYQYKAVY